MHRKGAQDKKRAQLFARLSREIMVAAKSGGDPSTNARLRLAVQSARAERMPKDNIDRAIQKGQGGGDTADYMEIRYEGYGPAGVAIIVDVLTDNRNRSAADVRALFSKNGGNLGESGSVAFQFDRLGEIAYAAAVAGEEVMFEAALEAGAQEVNSDGDEGHEILCAPDELMQVAGELEKKFGEALRVKLTYRPKIMVPVAGELALTLLKLIDNLEDHEDVQSVYANCEIDEVDLAQFAEN